MNTQELTQMLATRYCQPEYAFLTNVRNGTGYVRATTYADAFAMSLYPSRGLAILGFELKISRSDWLRELKKPDKAEEGIYGFCDNWYLVAGDDKIVHLDELPKTWGLIVAKGNRLFTVKPAPELKPKPVDRLLLASIFRNVIDGMVSRDSIKGEMAAEFERGVKWSKSEVERAEKKTQEKESIIKTFEETTGIKINEDWGITRVQKVAKAVNTVLAKEDTDIKYNIRWAKDNLTSALKKLDEYLAQHPEEK